MNDLINGIINDRALQLGLAAGLGLTINLVLGICGQQWTALKSQRYASIILPPAGAIITWTISSNLALSLGMIGALSIVRFRTPIKNPCELVTFFCYLILGISAGVNPTYTIALAGIVCITPFAVMLLDSVIGSIGFPILRKLRSKTEFAATPVQMVVQMHDDQVAIPAGIPADGVVAISGQPDANSGRLLVDLTVSFNSHGEALECLNALDKNDLVYSSVRSTES